MSETVPREAMEAAVFALHLFDYNDEEVVTRYVARWRTFKAHLTKPHMGDCTGVPMSCSRCQAEWIMEITDRFVRDSTTTEDDNLDWHWDCFLCGTSLNSIGPKNRRQPHYDKHRLMRDIFPNILVCDSCADKLA